MKCSQTKCKKLHKQINSKDIIQHMVCMMLWWWKFHHHTSKLFDTLVKFPSNFQNTARLAEG